MAPKKKPAKKPAAKAPAKRSAPKKPPVKKPTPPRPMPVRAPATPAVPPPPSPPPTPTTSDYSAYRDRQAGISRVRSAKGREIGAIPDILDPDRRERCRGSLRLFCETYNPDAFRLGWSDDHLKAITRIEEAATLGALYAFAMARGSGKTTLCRMAALWAASYRLCRYAFVIGATAPKARDTLDTLRILIRFLPDYAGDFPEISYPAIALAGIANRATGQTSSERSTLIEWSADRIVLPTVAPPSNWPRHWPLRTDGLVPTSGSIISSSGLTGEGIRGSLKTLTTGEMVRPDFVLLDDPQTPESARSRDQNTTRLQLVSADVLGMAGPGLAIAAVMPCTVIEPGDMVDEILNREKHPLWRGERSGILKSMPEDLAAWDRYFEIFGRCAQLEPPDFSESTAYYLAHQAELEAGAEASWPDRHEDWEVSAIQSAMHLYFRDARAFWAEYMNQPQDSNPAAAAALDPEALAAKTTNLPRRMVPRGCTRLTAMIDVGAHVLWYAVCALDESFAGGLIDCGSYPDQQRTYFTAADVRPALEEMPGVVGHSQDVAIYTGLTGLAAQILSRAYLQEETGAVMRIERCLIDANWGPGTDLVYEFCRRSAFAGLLYPSHGKFIGASSNPMSAWTAKPGERKGAGWRLSAPESGRGRHVVFDANWWKTFVAERLRTPAGAAGCWSLFAPGPETHRMLVDHLTAEYPIEVEGRGRRVEEWKDRPNRDNHWWDCLVGCAVAASVQGLTWSAQAAAGGTPPPKKLKKKLDIEHLYREARQRETQQGKAG